MELTKRSARLLLCLLLGLSGCDDTTSGPQGGVDILDDDDSAGDDDDSAPGQVVDNDGDGFAAEDDCNDDEAAVNPAAAELCDGVDNNCDLSIDEGFDGDGDGVSTCGADGVAGNSDDDCDDTDIAIYPGAAEICDGSDNNCDGSSDENLVGVGSLGASR